MKESSDHTATPATIEPDNHSDAPHSSNANRRGWLKHGNAPGDFHNCARCGAKTRAGRACKSPAMRNGRCRMHGGKSTGPRTCEGRKKCAETHTVHGHYGKQYLEEERALRLASRANVIAGELLVHRIVETATQFGINMPREGASSVKLSPAKLHNKRMQSQRILEQLWEIPSFRALWSGRQLRKLRMHIARCEKREERARQR